MVLIEKILLLDSSVENISFIREVLSKLSRKFHIFEASDTTKALDIVESEKIQLVITAWETEPIPGTTFCNKIRLNKSNKVIPFLLYSKEISEEELSVSKKFGYENILKTPLDPLLLRDKILVILDQEENMSREEKKLRKIKNLLEDGDPTAALKYFDSSLNKPAYRLERDLLLSRQYLLTKKFDAAQKVLDLLSTDFPENITVIRLRARSLFLQGQHESSCKLFEQNLKQDSEDLISAVYLISQLVELNKRQEAEKIFSEMLDHPVLGKTDQHHVIPLSILLYIETHGGNDVAKHLNNFALIYTQKNEIEKAIAVYKKGVCLLDNPVTSSLFQYNLALAYKKINKLNESFTYFCHSYLCDPENEKSYAALVKISRDLNAGGNPPDKNLINKVKKKKFEYEQDKSKDIKAG